MVLGCATPRLLVSPPRWLAADTCGCLSWCVLRCTVLVRAVCVSVCRHLDGFKERGGRAAFHEVGKARRGGFDTWLGYENNNSQYDCWLHGHTEDGTEVPREDMPACSADALSRFPSERLLK